MGVREHWLVLPAVDVLPPFEPALRHFDVRVVVARLDSRVDLSLKSP